MPLVLVSPAEEEELRATLLAELRENVVKTCPRPPLWETPLPGRPDPLLVAFVESEGELRRCAEALTAPASTWRQTVFSPATARRILPSVGSPPPRSHRGASPPDRLDEACAGLPEHISRAVRFEGACSPYLPGRRRLPEREQLMRLVVLLDGAAVLAWRRGGEDPLAAARLLVETLRLHQDLCRGGTAWIWPFVLRGPLRYTVAVLGALLASGELSAEALVSLDQALATLMESEPSPASHLRGEQLTVELATFLVPLMPRGWIPPGGEASPTFDPASGILSRTLGSPRQDLLLGWMAHRMRHARWQASCVEGESSARCLEALEGFFWEVSHRVQHLAERWEALGLSLSEALRPKPGRPGGTSPRDARQVALEWLVAFGPTTGPEHLRRWAERLFWIAALRIHIAVLLEQPRRGEPITAGQVLALTSPHRDPFWGEAFVAQGTPGAVELRPSRPLMPSGEPKLSYTVKWRIPGAP